MIAPLSGVDLRFWHVVRYVRGEPVERIAKRLTEKQAKALAGIRDDDTVDIAHCPQRLCRKRIAEIFGHKRREKRETPTPKYLKIDVSAPRVLADAVSKIMTAHRGRRSSLDFIPSTVAPPEIRKEQAEWAIEAARGNRTRAAEMLLISRSTLYRWLQDSDSEDQSFERA